MHRARAKTAILGLGCSRTRLFSGSVILGLTCSRTQLFSGLVILGLGHSRARLFPLSKILETVIHIVEAVVIDNTEYKSIISLWRSETLFH